MDVQTYGFIVAECILAALAIFQMFRVARLERRWKGMKQIIAAQRDFVPDQLRKEQQDTFRYATNWWVSAFVRQMNELDGTPYEPDPPADQPVSNQSVTEVDANGSAA